MTRIKCVVPLLRVKRILMREGLFPVESFAKSQVKKLIAHFVCYTTLMCMVMMNGVNATKAGDGMAVNHAISILIPMIKLYAIVITILRKKVRFISIMDDLSSDTFNIHSEKSNHRIQLVYRISELIWKYYIAVITIYMSIAAILPFATNARLMIPSPFYLGRYAVLYKLLHIVVCAYLALNSICFDVLLMSLLGLCIAQLYILEDKLVNVFEQSRENHGSNSIQTEKTRQEQILKECVVLYEAISRFVDKLSMILSLPMLIQYTCGCFIICNAILQLTIMGETSTTNVLNIVAYASITFSQIAVYHWLGNEIIFKSGGIINACYLSKWYNLNLNSQKSLIILMERAKRPLVVQLYKLVFISLETLGVIVRWSYSLFALIKARYN